MKIYRVTIKRVGDVDEPVEMGRHASKEMAVGVLEGIEAVLRYLKRDNDFEIEWNEEIES